jgi:diguanylate cyclase (GGDEF)-like protein/PAS domain S-box-containing protein
MVLWMFAPSNLSGRRPAAAFKRLSALLRRHANARWVVPLWLIASLAIALVFSQKMIGRTVDHLLRSEAERVARDWARYAIAMVPDIDKVVRDYSTEKRYDEIVRTLEGTERVFLFKIFDKAGQLVLTNDKARREQANAGVRSHNAEAARVVFSGQPFTEFFSYSQKPGRPKHYSEAYIPVLRDGAVVAVVEVYVDQTQIYTWHKSQEMLLSTTIAVMVVLSFGVPALFLLGRSRQAARAEAASREDNLRLRSAINSIPEGVSLYDSGNRLVASNKQHAEMYRLPDPLSEPGTHLRDIVRAVARTSLRLEPGKAVAQICAPIIEADHTVVQTWSLRDGRVIDVTTSPLCDGGRMVRHKDVTEERQAAWRLAESEARFRDFAASAADWCWETDADHRFTSLTEGFQSSTGIAPEAVIGRKRGHAEFHPDDAAAVAAHLKDQDEQRPFRDARFRVRKADGSYACTMSTGAPRFAADGTFLGYRGTARDVTAEEVRKGELRNAEDALRLRSKQLVDAQRLGKIGDWSYSLGAAHVEWGLELFELLRCDPSLRRMDYALLMANYIGDGAQKVLECQKEIAATGKVGSVDVKYRRGDGVIIDCDVTSKPVYGSDGQLTGFSGTIQDITERKQAEEQLTTLAFYDPLTGLANRALFARRLEAELTECARTGSTAALLLLDLDHFKEVNDSLGHSAGDELLIKVGQIISHALGGMHFLARLGGDEFAIIASRCESQEAAEALARKVIEAVSGSIHLALGEVMIGTSVGLTLVGRSSRDSTELLRIVDLALYSAKEGGRGRFAVFRPEMDACVQHKSLLARELRRAIAEETGLAVHYQPQVCLKTGLIRSYEALVRWRHPTLGEISPSQFIPIAEGSQLIVDLGRWVLREAAGQTKAWIDAGEPERAISVNVSAAQIWHSDLVTDVGRILRETGIAPRLVSLELTESLLVDHAEDRVRTVLNGLKDLGVTLALDDFGTGYSSLCYLKQLPFHTLKIDRVFVEGVAESEQSRDFLQGIVSLGHGLGMAVVAEGAEKLEELRILENLGCDLVQGYIVARPLPAEAANAFANSYGRPPRINAVHALQERLSAEVA